MDTENDLTSIIKQYSSFIVFALINVYVFYWIYNNFIKEQPQQNQSIPAQNIQRNNINNTKTAIKPKMTISINGLLFKDEKSIDESKFYQLLDTLSDKYELFLILKVDEHADTNALLEKFKTVIEDNPINTVNLEQINNEVTIDSLPVIDDEELNLEVTDVNEKERMNDLIIKLKRRGEDNEED